MLCHQRGGVIVVRLAQQMKKETGNSFWSQREHRGTRGVSGAGAWRHTSLREVVERLKTYGLACYWIGRGKVQAGAGVAGSARGRGCRGLWVAGENGVLKLKTATNEGFLRSKS